VLTAGCGTHYAIEHYARIPMNGLDGYALFLISFEFVAFPILVFHTGYIGLVLQRFVSRSAKGH
jgi:hypothetical protein